MTSKRLPRTFGIRIAKILFVLSLLLSCVTFGAGDPEAQLRALKGQSPEVQLHLLNEWNGKGRLDPELSSKVKSIDEALADQDVPDGYLAGQMTDVLDMLQLRVREGAPATSDAVKLAKEIKSSPIYRDSGVREQANWLSGAASRLNNLQPDCSCDQPQASTPTMPAMGHVVTYAVYGILALGLLGFLLFALNRFAWSQRLQRKAKALMDEDEPERTLDEWLALADRLEREGKYREAVRCLYLACLLKIDEARIARFERSETNWEHLARIEASPKKPPDLDFRAPTKAFDTIWYGMRVNGSEDVMRFRAWYRQVTESVRSKAA